MKKRNLTILALLAVLLLTLTACGSQKKATDTLIYGSSDYTAINPALYEHGEINTLLFLGLTTHDAQNNIAPGAAEQWTIDSKTNTYRFTLRDGLTFHDGKPLTAADVKFTLEAIQNPDNGSENASDFEDIKEIRVPDARHVELVLKAPNAAMLDYLTMGILPKHLLQGKDMTTDPFNQKPVGAGPYRLTAWERGQSITLEKNPNFYKGEPKISKVIFKIVEDYDARALQLQSGELDFAQTTPKAMAQFQGDDQFKTYIMDTADYRGILYNFNNPLFKKNPELPAALSYAIDRKTIVDSVLLGHGQVAYSPLQKNAYNNPNVETYSYNPEKTKKRLEKAGWKKSDDGIYEKKGQPLAFTINCPQGDQVRTDMATICAQNLKDIGAKVDVKTPAEIDWENQAAYLVGWGSPFDPDTHTYKIFGTKQASNYSAYSNKKVDRLLKQARELTTKEERLPLYKQFQEQLAKAPAFTYLAYIDAIYAGKSNITGITPQTVLGHHGVGIFWNIYDWEIKE